MQKPKKLATNTKSLRRHQDGFILRGNLKTFLYANSRLKIPAQLALVSIATCRLNWCDGSQDDAGTGEEEAGRLLRIYVTPGLLNKF